MQVASPLDVDGEAVAAVSEAHSIKVAAAKIVVIDGVVSDQLSSTEGLPHQAFVGSLRDAPLDLMAQYLVWHTHPRATMDATMPTDLPALRKRTCQAHPTNVALLHPTLACMHACTCC